MSICSKCGANVPDGSNFCVACGTPVAPAPQPQAQPFNGQPQNFQQAQAKPQMNFNDVKKQASEGADKLTDAVNKATKQNFGKPVVIGVCAALVVVVIAIIITILAHAIGGGYAKPIKKFAKALDKNKYTYMVDAMVPSKYQNTDAKSNIKDYVERYEDYESYEIEVYDAHEVDEDEALDYSEEYSDDLQSLCDDDDIDIEFSKVMKVTCHVSYEDEDGDEYCYATEFVVGKYKGKWYLCN